MGNKEWIAFANEKKCNHAKFDGLYKVNLLKVKGRN